MSSFHIINGCFGCGVTKSAEFLFPYRQRTYCHTDVSLAISGLILSGLILNPFLSSVFSEVHFKTTDPF